jgi:hypothetical protein
MSSVTITSVAVIVKAKRLCIVGFYLNIDKTDRPKDLARLTDILPPI